MVIAGIQRWDLFGCYMYFCKFPYRRCLDHMCSVDEMAGVSPKNGDGHFPPES